MSGGPLGTGRCSGIASPSTFWGVGPTRGNLLAGLFLSNFVATGAMSSGTVLPVLMSSLSTLDFVEEGERFSVGPIFRSQHQVHYGTSELRGVSRGKGHFDPFQRFVIVITGARLGSEGIGGGARLGYQIPALRGREGSRLQSPLASWDQCPVALVFELAKGPTLANAPAARRLL